MVGRLDERYLKQEQIGSGGMSVVYKGRDSVLDREVAIKILHPHLAEKEESRRRFVREARAVAKLHHPNILEIFDFSGDDPKESFIVTEYINGQTLRAFAEKVVFHPPEIAAMAVHELAGALEHAHAAGIIHRDLKPENVMIRQDGVIKLMDFGIAKVIDREDRMTMTGALVGSPAHMAPEIIEGQEASRAADIFSLGTILYWLCCRKLPFVGNNTTQTLKLILDGTYPDPRSENKAVSDDLAMVIRRCLAREPAARYPTANDLKDALTNSLAGCEVENIGLEFKRFFDAPPAYSASFQKALVARLLKEADSYARGANRNYARAVNRLDRILALEPENGQALSLMAATRQRDRRLRQVRDVAKALGSLVVLGAICLGGYKGFEAWRARPTPESLVPPPKEIVKPPDPTPPELKPDVKPPELKPVATDPIKPDVKAPIKLDKPDKPKKNPEVAVKTPDPIPIGPVEAREIKINLIPQIHSATIHVDGVSEVMKNQPQWELTLPVGAHVARVECPGCLSEPFQFTVETEVRVPVLKPVALQLRFRAHLEAAVEDPDAKVLVDGLEMKPTDDPSRRALDYDYSLEREEKAKIVTIQIVQEGRPTRTWSQAISAGRPMVLKPEIR